jgi:succinylglutamate desuccinylase
MKHVFLVGGTHGNEWTGVTIVKHLKHRINQSQLEVSFVLANPKAHEINRRFVDIDLNRVFARIHQNEKIEAYEYQRGLELIELFHQRPESVIIDLHTTTGNLGRTIILTQETPWHQRLALYVSQKLPDTKIILALDHSKKYVGTQLERGVIVEIGPCTSSTNNPLIIEQSLELINCLLDYIHQADILSLSGSYTYYVESIEVPYPKENGEFVAMVHPSLQNREFMQLKPAMPLLQKYNGEDIVLEGKQEYYPIFINEASYYHYNIAMVLCEQKKQSL